MTKRSIKSFLKNRDEGTAGIEFALVLPVMALLLFGAMGVFDYIFAKKQSLNAADQVSDLLTRSVDLNNASAREIFDAAYLTMDGYANRVTMNIVMTGWVYIEDEDAFEVAWSNEFQSVAKSGGVVTQQQGLTIGTKQQATSLGFPSVINGQMLVQSEIQYSYRSPFDIKSMAPINYAANAVRKPRYVAKIAWLNQ